MKEGTEKIEMGFCSRQSAFLLHVVLEDRLNSDV